jgi:hypothetical protein
MLDRMKRLALLALVLVGCFDVSHDGVSKCFGIGPREGEDRSCSFVAPTSPEEFACPNLRFIRYDGVRLSASDATIQCFPDGSSMILVDREGCEDHFVEACVE